MSKKKIGDFKKEVWKYYRAQGRDFTWRRTRDAYRIFVSEVMLQQTQTFRVAPKYLAFLKAFPNVPSLAAAPVSKVLQAWQGLGYNRRALWLQRAAQIIVREHGGKLPRDGAALLTLPGIGPNTVGSLRAFAFNDPVVFIETNIRRAYIHYFFPTAPNVHDRQLLPLIEKTLDKKNPRQWYYALMDYGAMLGKRGDNPNRRSVHYARQSKFEGSRRQVRGAILKLLLQGPATPAVITKELGREKKLIAEILKELSEEGFVTKQKGSWRVNS